MSVKKNKKIKTLAFQRLPGEAPMIIAQDKAMYYGELARTSASFCLAEYYFKQIAEAFPKDVAARLKWLEVAVLLGDDEVIDSLIAELEKLKVKRGDLLPLLGERALQDHDATLALEYTKHLLLLRPSSAQAHFLLGSVYKTLGENQRAVEAYDSVIARSPRHAQPFYLRGLILRQNISDKQRQQLDAALAAVDENDVSSFAWLNLAKAWSHYGDVEEEFKYLDRAKLRMAACFDERPEVFEEDFKKVAAFCTESKLKAARSVWQSEDAPVFVVAMGRSGTTLLESILGAHRDFFATGERGFVLKAAERLALSVGRFDPFWEWGSRFELKDLLSSFHGKIAKHSAIKAANGRRWIDKSLSNYFYMGLMKMIFPGAKFIHIKRHPMAVCLSNYQHHMGFRSTVPITLEQLAHYYLAIDRAIAYWQTLFGDDILVLEYESLTQDFEGQLRKLLAFLGAEWDDTCLKFNEQKSVVLTPSTMSVRAPVNQDAEKRWMKYEKHLQPVAKVLNL